MSALASHSGISTLAGTPGEIGVQLGRSQAERVLVVAFPQLALWLPAKLGY